MHSARGLGRRVVRGAIVLGGVAIVVATVTAHATRAQTPAGSQQTPTFRAGITLVTTDVIVRDQNGQFVADLQPEDFELLEDGVRQEVASLVLIHGGRAFNLHAPPPPVAPEGIVLPPSRPTSDAAGRIFLLFVDDLHMDFRDTMRVRELFEEILETLVHEGDLFGIISTGPSSLSIDMTYDRRKLKDAIKRITGHAMRPSEIVVEASEADGSAELRYRAQVAFATAYQVLQNLEQVTNRRKAFVYVSNGYDFNPFKDERRTWSVERGGLFSADDPENPFAARQAARASSRVDFSAADLVRQLAELIRVANRANASIYAIDPRGLRAGADMDEGISDTSWWSYMRNSQDSLRVLAEETGGIAVLNENHFGPALKRIDAETSDYYVLGFYSSNPDPQRRVRRIKVDVKRPDLDVWSRQVYSIRTDSADSSAR